MLGENAWGPPSCRKTDSWGTAAFLTASHEQTQPSRSPEAPGQLGPSLQNVRSWWAVGAGRQTGLQLIAAVKTARTAVKEAKQEQPQAQWEAGPPTLLCLTFDSPLSPLCPKSRVAGRGQVCPSKPETREPQDWTPRRAPTSWLPAAFPAAPLWAGVTRPRTQFSPHHRRGGFTGKSEAEVLPNRQITCLTGPPGARTQNLFLLGRQPGLASPDQSQVLP